MIQKPVKKVVYQLSVKITIEPSPLLLRVNQ